MPYTRDSVPDDHSEFGGGPGLVDPILRAERVFDSQPYAELWEIYATDTTTQGKEEAVLNPEETILERPS